MPEFKLRPSPDGSEPFIELNKLLKVLRLVESGAQANLFIDDSLVTLNGKIETRKRAKLHNGDLVGINNQTIKIISPA